MDAIGMLLAQGSGVEPLSGGAGWVGAGLLSLVLGWLLFRHLPEKDRLILLIIDSRDKMMSDLHNRHSEVIKSLGASITTAVERVTSHCKEELEVIVAKTGWTKEQLEGAITKVLTRHFEKGKSP